MTIDVSRCENLLPFCPMDKEVSPNTENQNVEASRQRSFIDSQTTASDASRRPTTSAFDEEEISEVSSVASYNGSVSPSEVSQQYLTVHNKSKIEQNSLRKDKRPDIPYVTTFVKWLATLILGVLLLGSLITSKITIISLAGAFNSTQLAQEPDTNNTEFSMLLIVLLVPNVITLIRSLWVGGITYSTPWPDKFGIFLCILSSLFESVGLCVFVFRQLGNRAAVSDITFLNMVFMFTIIYNVYRCCRIGVWRVKGWFALFLVAMFFEVAGTALNIYTNIEVSFKDDIIDLCETVGAIFLISIAWIPTVQKRQLQPRNLSPQQESGDAHILLQNVSESKTARWKAGIISSFCKIVFICLSAGYLNSEFVIELFNQNDNIWHWEKNDLLLNYFVANIASSIAGMTLAFVTCHMSLDVGAFALPIFLSTPISTALTIIPVVCEKLIPIDGHTSPLFCPEIKYGVDDLDLILSYGGMACLVIAEILATWYIVWKKETVLLPNESQIFWIPGFNGVLLEEWLVLSRRREPDETNVDFRERARRTRIYICTTMYRESDDEMKQLLESISRVNVAQHGSVRHFEAHIFFDGGVKETQPTEFALQLLSLLPETLDIKLADCQQIKTPYGLCLAWKLPVSHGGNEMKFRIHFKDNLKVKNKKRWSQIMYMSYVLDFLLKEEDNSQSDVEGFILTTDADVFFTPDSVEALMDLMTRDEKVGAVCARTHPLGDGPLVWYQVFEYSIGHWFQKTSEHVLGSVLCSPGCFSVYRCKAIMDILPSYSTTVNHAFDFLIKDMGEDRWFCTLMIQSGWRIDYCAVASNSTHCPDNFDEFFKQRRRWIASTIANLMLVIKEWRLLIRFNKEISVIFILYQAVLLFSTLIGPSTVMLVVSGGLQYGWHAEPATSLIFQYVACIFFGVLCLFGSSSTQLKFAKFMTFMYAIVMSVVAIGTAVQIAKDIQENEGVSDDLPLSISDLYLFGLMGIFVITSIVHLTEIFSLLNGIWYLLCLPSGYLVLMIYSVCNLTDRSWGTREDNSGSPSAASGTSWYEGLWVYIKELFPCFQKPSPKQFSQGSQTDKKQPNKIEPDVEEDLENGSLNSLDLPHHSLPPETTDRVDKSKSKNQHEQDVTQGPKGLKFYGQTTLLPHRLTKQVSASLQNHSSEFESRNNTYFQYDYMPDQYIPIPVEKWLPDEFKELYISKFRRHGYEDTRLISGMKESELKDIGIKFKGHRQHLLQRIKLLPDFEPNTEVPETADEWLENIGLAMYKKNFAENQIITQENMAVLKSMSLHDIKKELDVRKSGHVKRLYDAIRKLREPTKDEKTRAKIRHDLMMIPVQKQTVINPEESEFWDSLRKACLVPDTGFGREEELKEKLGDLRNNWVIIMAVSNSLWLVVLATMATQARLTVLSSNPFGFLFLAVFGFIFVLQFLCMLIHRLETLVHILARAPYRFGDGYKTSWSFSDKRLTSNRAKDINDFEALIARKKAKDRQRLEESIFSQQISYGTITEH